MKRAGLLLVCALLFAMSACGAGEVYTWGYGATEDVLDNPLMGNAVWADDLSEHTQPFSLVYSNITWAELEPTEGAYAFTEIEEKYHFEEWRSRGKHMILRFVMDIPSEEAHCDLPSWLMLRAGGSAYDISYGRGWCPHYGDEALLEAHHAAIEALGERYDSDPFVSLVELGSLGHWGEWHVHEDAGTMPEEAVRDRYVTDYLEAFRETKLLMRRPFNIAAEQGLGLYNDTAGDMRSTLRWLEWIENGGSYEGTANALAPMSEGWKTGPVGGELAIGQTAFSLLQEDGETLIALFRLSHTSWIGPHSFADQEESYYLNQLMASIGYRLRVTESRLEGRKFTFSLTNDGIAPFYYRWPVRLKLTDAEGAETIVETDLDLREVLPSVPVECSVTLPRTGALRRISLAVIDPMTDLPAVQLAMEAETENGWYVLGELP